ncbi:menaquinone biosynthetic enzyme MqnA/MqnD family protein [Paucidesulfovibrio longus]|uniref:menaquinone biosynthetic enzyme MqnA/MqnD family protein n=1 Tax=Paucidesulfovibrio longus TaxID=889 RepID=UPI0003B3F547|nr:menaquinone biosynthesis protein [Paucidesulfovibrio longus]
MNARLKLGKIGYRNVLPIYHPLEQGLVPHELEIVSGVPAELNEMMRRGELHLSANSSIEYARRSERYLLVPDLAIGCHGPVQSVLLLSRRPVRELAGQSILVSAQTHTSAALLRLLLARRYKVEVRFESGDATSMLARGDKPEAILAIGDEALELRRHPDYPHLYDLGQEWLEWTGMPFIFGVWIILREAWDANRIALENAVNQLLRAKQWGQEHISELCGLASCGSSLDALEMCSYFNGLSYDLGDKEKTGLERFFALLSESGIIESAPELRFAELERSMLKAG